jgi:hypothetical protein
MPATLPSLVGQRFDRLLVVARDESRDGYGSGHRFWFCQCDCGTTKSVSQNGLRKGTTRSCGCKSVKHGLSGRIEFRAWTKMRARCECKTDAAYCIYGERGIKVCERWCQFENFLSDMGPRPSNKHSVDRIDNDGDYEPLNCRWATKKDQARNRRNTRYAIIGGTRKPIIEWCDERGMPYRTVIARIDRSGWSVEDALKYPVTGMRGVRGH